MTVRQQENKQGKWIMIKENDNNNADNDGNDDKDISVKESTSQSQSPPGWKKCPVVTTTRKIPQKAKPLKIRFGEQREYTLSL